MDNRPIGVIDSGLGGLSVYNDLRTKLPKESFVYFGDGLNCPYGNKSVKQIKSYLDYALERLLQHNIKLLVVACNSATAMGIDYLREKYDLPIVGMEPAVKPAALSSKSGVVGVLATAATFKGDLFKDTCAKYPDVKIIESVGEGFVELVESGQENTIQADVTVDRAMEEIIDKGADHLVLGCTHYPFLKASIQKSIAELDITIIDPAPAITKRTEQLLDKFNLRASSENVACDEFISAADENYRQKLINKALKWQQ